MTVKRAIIVEAVNGVLYIHTSKNSARCPLGFLVYAF